MLTPYFLIPRIYFRGGFLLLFNRSIERRNAQCWRLQATIQGLGGPGCALLYQDLVSRDSRILAFPQVTAAVRYYCTSPLLSLSRSGSRRKATKVEMWWFTDYSDFQCFSLLRVKPRCICLDSVKIL